LTNVQQLIWLLPLHLWNDVTKQCHLITVHHDMTGKVSEPSAL